MKQIKHDRTSLINTKTITEDIIMDMQLKMNFQTAKGVRDLPPEEKILKNKVVDTIKRTFELYGFSPLETPTIERYETLTAKFGAGADSDVLKETFTLEDQGKRKLGLRFEMTTSLARYVAMNPTIKMPFKTYQILRRFYPLLHGNQKIRSTCYHLGIAVIFFQHGTRLGHAPGGKIIKFR